jgi:hypothetical protein
LTSSTGKYGSTKLAFHGATITLARIERVVGQLPADSYDLMVEERRPDALATAALTGSYSDMGNTFARAWSETVPVTRAP